MYRLGGRCLGGGAAEPVAGVRRHDGHLGAAGWAAGLRAAGRGAVPDAGAGARHAGVVAGAGLCAGLALFSKYSAVLTLAGAVLFLLTSPRASAAGWQDAKAVARAGGGIAGVLAGAGMERARMAGLRSRSRASAPTGWRFHPLAPLVTLGGEALFVLPWIWVPMMVVFIAALRRGPGEWRSLAAVLPRRAADCGVCPDLGLVGPARAVPLGSAWLPDAVPAAGGGGGRRIDRPPVRRLVWGTAAFVVLAVAVVATQVRFDWLTGDRSSSRTRSGHRGGGLDIAAR